MAWFSSKKLPAETHRSLREALERRGGPDDARVLASAATPGGVAVALPGHLAVLTEGSWEVFAWHELVRANWAPDGTRLVWCTVESPHLDRSVDVTRPGHLPEVVQERLNQTIVLQQPAEIAPGKRVVITGRRPATGADTDLQWTVVPGRGVDLSRPEYAEAAEQLLEGVRHEWA